MNILEQGLALQAASVKVKRRVRVTFADCHLPADFSITAFPGRHIDEARDIVATVYPEHAAFASFEVEPTEGETR